MKACEFETGRRHFIASALAALVTLTMLPGGAGTAWGAGGASENLKKWKEMPETEREAYRKRWREFKAQSPKEQEELRMGLGKYKALPEAEQQLVRKNYEIWKELTPEERAEIRERFEKLQEMSEVERSALRAKNKGWESLSKEEQKKQLEEARQHGDPAQPAK